MKLHPNAKTTPLCARADRPAGASASAGPSQTPHRRRPSACGRPIAGWHVIAPKAWRASTTARAAPGAFAHRTAPRRVRSDRATAPSSADGGADRRAARDAALDGGRRAEAPRARATLAADPQAGRGALRARAAGRAAAPGHQETRAIPPRRPSHHGRSHAGNSRRAGWEFAHVCVDDHSRLAYVEVLADEQRRDRRPPSCGGPCAGSAARHPHRARAHRQRQRLPLARASPRPASELGLRHLRTRPYTPRTNGKAERFIQTMLREWAYATALSHLEPAHEAARPLAALLQPPATPRGPERSSPSQPNPEASVTNAPGLDT